MSLEALERFGKLVSEDASLQQAIQTSMENGDDVGVFVELGQQHGCDFTDAEAVCMMSGLDGVEGNSCAEPHAAASGAGNASHGFRDPDTDLRVGANFQANAGIGERISRWRWSLNGW
jgi:hypothetical protein